MPSPPVVSGGLTIALMFAGLCGVTGTAERLWLPFYTLYRRGSRALAATVTLRGISSRDCPKGRGVAQDLLGQVTSDVAQSLPSRRRKHTPSVLAPGCIGNFAVIR